MSQDIDSGAIRRAILDSIPPDLFAADKPVMRFVYLPDSHVRALDPDCMLVVGARGSGKSFWWGALQDPETLRVVTGLFPSRSHDKLHVVGGWGMGSQPDKDTLAPLLSMSSRIIWKTIVLDRIDPGFFAKGMLWKDRAALVQNDPENVARRLAAIDEELLSARTRQLVLFDALDVVADSWAARQKLLKGLFELLLEFRYTRSIRLKAFVRTDAVEDPEIRTFPDASKLLHARVELAWPKIDLYGLFWQHLGNAKEGGGDVRRLFKGWRGDANRWELPEKLRKEEDIQSQLFIRLAGEKMGRSAKRGRPYSWIPNHLADAKGRTTPRSFLAAMRTAAQRTATDHVLALDWKAIQQGVVTASEIRVHEIHEEFAWMEVVMEPLRGLTVPCEQKEVVSRWKHKNVLETIEKEAGTKQPPPSFRDGYPGLLHDLEQFGVLEERSDRRINLPDLYRVKFGLGRKGGVRPAR